MPACRGGSDERAGWSKDARTGTTRGLVDEPGHPRDGPSRGVRRCGDGKHRHRASETARARRTSVRTVVVTGIALPTTGSVRVRTWVNGGFVCVRMRAIGGAGASAGTGGVACPRRSKRSRGTPRARCQAHAQCEQQHGHYAPCAFAGSNLGHASELDWLRILAKCGAQGSPAAWRLSNSVSTRGRAVRAGVPPLTLDTRFQVPKTVRQWCSGLSSF